MQIWVHAIVTIAQKVATMKIRETFLLQHVNLVVWDGTALCQELLLKTTARHVLWVNIQIHLVPLRSPTVKSAGKDFRTQKKVHLHAKNVVEDNINPNKVLQRALCVSVEHIWKMEIKYMILYCASNALLGTSPFQTEALRASNVLLESTATKENAANAPQATHEKIPTHPQIVQLVLPQRIKTLRSKCGV